MMRLYDTALARKAEKDGTVPSIPPFEKDRAKWEILQTSSKDAKCGSAALALSAAAQKVAFPADARIADNLVLDGCKRLYKDLEEAAEAGDKDAEALRNNVDIDLLAPSFYTATQLAAAGFVNQQKSGGMVNIAIVSEKDDQTYRAFWPIRPDRQRPILYIHHDGRAHFSGLKPLIQTTSAIDRPTRDLPPAKPFAKAAGGLPRTKTADKPTGNLPPAKTSARHTGGLPSAKTSIKPAGGLRPPPQSRRKIHSVAQSDNTSIPTAPSVSITSKNDTGSKDATTSEERSESPTEAMANARTREASTTSSSELRNVPNILYSMPKLFSGPVPANSSLFEPDSEASGAIGMTLKDAEQLDLELSGDGAGRRRKSGHRRTGGGDDGGGEGSGSGDSGGGEGGGGGGGRGGRGGGGGGGDSGSSSGGGGGGGGGDGGSSAGGGSGNDPTDIYVTCKLSLRKKA